jgi:hypothetical protein
VTSLSRSPNEFQFRGEDECSPLTAGWAALLPHPCSLWRQVGVQDSARQCTTGSGHISSLAVG